VGLRCAAASPPEVLEEVRFFSSSFPPLRIILLPSCVLATFVYRLAVASSTYKQCVIRTLRQLYKLRRLLRCVFCLRCSALAFCFSLGRIADEKHTNTSLCRTFVLLFRVCVQLYYIIQLSVILYYMTSLPSNVRIAYCLRGSCIFKPKFSLCVQGSFYKTLVTPSSCRTLSFCLALLS